MPRKSFHLKSMTAYGRAAVDFSYGRFTVEIQSINRRHLEINVGLPRQLMRYEMDIRNWISLFIGRGMISVSVYWKSDSKKTVSVQPNLALAKAVKEAWEQISEKLRIKETVSLELLSKEKDMLLYEEEIQDESAYKKALEQTVFSALEELLLMRHKEGEKLAADLDKRLKALKKTIHEVEKLSQGVSEKYRAKLTDRLNELLTPGVENEERILREIALFAEKIDITEEMVRFQSHLEQFQTFLKKPFEKPTESRGKTLEFLIQELNREINTIGSKTTEVSVSQHVIFAKGELERMREQVQNIE